MKLSVDDDAGANTAADADADEVFNISSMAEPSLGQSLLTSGIRALRQSESAIAGLIFGAHDESRRYMDIHFAGPHVSSNARFFAREARAHSAF
jgi:hypothetical protein